MRQILIQIFCLLLPSLASNFLWADLVYLKNGKILENVKIIAAANSVITVEEAGKRLRFSSDEVLRLRYNQNQAEPIHILLNDSTLINGYLVDQENEMVIIRRQKDSPREESYKKSDIKQMSNQPLILYFPDLTLKGGLLYTFNSKGADLAPALFFGLDFSVYPPWLKNFMITVNTGYAKAESNGNPGLSFQTIHLSLDFGYIWQFGITEKPNDVLPGQQKKKKWYQPLALIPYLGLGSSYVIFDDGEGESSQGLLPTFAGGCSLRYEVVPRTFFVLLTLGYEQIMEDSLKFHNGLVNLSLKYRY